MRGLSNNQLKLIALATMTVDHVGMLLFPRVVWLRLVGRLAFPIFAYMIAEGCRHTRSMGRYFGAMAVFALMCQIVDFLATGSLYMSILVTFSLSIGLIWLIQKAEAKPLLPRIGIIFAGLAAVFCFCQVLPGLLPGTDFNVDYGFLGVLVPALVYKGKNKKQRLVYLSLGLCLLALDHTWVQWFALAAVPVLMLYNGQRGKWNLKWLFYIYYPAHLVILYGIAFLL